MIALFHVSPEISGICNEDRGKWRVGIPEMKMIWAEEIFQVILNIR